MSQKTNKKSNSKSGGGWSSGFFVNSNSGKTNGTTADNAKGKKKKKKRKNTNKNKSKNDTKCLKPAHDIEIKCNKTNKKQDPSNQTQKENDNTDEKTQQKMMNIVLPDYGLNNQWFYIKNTQKYGYGMFAKKDIPCGTVLLKEIALIECGSPMLYIKDDTGVNNGKEIPEVEYQFNKLSKKNQQIFLSLSDRNNQQNKLFDKYETNCMPTIRNQDLTPYKTGIFPVLSRVNHDCNANTSSDFPNFKFQPTKNINDQQNPDDKNKCKLHNTGNMIHDGNCNGSSSGYYYIHSLRDIKKGEEITTNYLGDIRPYNERKNKLRMWGFECKCQWCSDETIRVKMDSIIVKRLVAERKGTLESFLECIQLTKKYFDSSPFDLKRFYFHAARLAYATKQYKICYDCAVNGKKYWIQDGGTQDETQYMVLQAFEQKSKQNM